MEKTRILIVDDDDDLRSQMRWALAADYEVFLAGDRASSMDVLAREMPTVVMLDLGLPPATGDSREGLLALDEMLKSDPQLKIIVITGQSEKNNALAAIAQGAYDFFSKPIDIGILKTVVERAIHVSRLERENRELLNCTQLQSFEGMVGSSPQMQKVFDSVRKLSQTDAPVLVMGESGTGKELAARAIHRLSERRDGPFVPINCGAIPEHLLESELFGHEKGSFTGAHIQRQGRIEAAQGGTLFLDEIGELSPSLQVKLLRFLQERQIERVGGRKTIQVDARVISATNADLCQAMADGKFREDLYYRIGVVVIAMPPLRDRQGDIPLLAKMLLQRLTSEQKRPFGFDRRAIAAMEMHRWAGNVREMENKLRRAVIMADGNQITAADLELEGERAPCEGMGLTTAREAVERDLIERALARNKGNLTRCAQELKISRPTLYELIERLGIVR
ncbi:MAG TPA: PEP-CTERM-box response regulator transcription factor [Acidobacteriota bacterium]|nr:PEP-CTERM-box response regulator transcription factor [Acidobacteriota bacterium]